MSLQLTVTEPFGGYNKGDIIADPKTVQAVLEGQNAAHVVQTQAPEVPASKKTSKTTTD